MLIESFELGPFQSNCTILGCEQTKEAVVVDPGAEGAKIRAKLERHGLRLVRILLTHGHVDHVGAVGELLRSLPVPVAIHPGDRWLYEHVPLQAMMFGLRAEPLPAFQEELSHGQTITFGAGHRLEVLHTPGHSPGGVCFHLPAEQLAMVGDTLFSGSIGRTDLWGGDFPQLIRSIQERLLTLEPTTRLITGHGPDTTVAYEKRTNPFLQG